jgi:drug/metabolite transporter (DMT)-like permease
MSSRGIAAYSCLALFWAGLFCGFAVAVATLGVAVATGVFCLVSAVSLYAMARLVGRKLRWSPDWGRVLTWALLTLVVAGATMFAVASIGAALTAILISSIPLFSTVGDQMRGLERVTGLGAVSFSLGILGLVLVAAAPAAVAGWSFIAGVLAALVAAMSAGACGRELIVQTHQPKALETAILAGALSGVAAFGFVPLFPVPGGEVWDVLMLATLAVISGFLALFALSSASDSVPRRIVATLPGVGTVLAAIAGAVVLRESVMIAQWLGMVFILAGTALLRGLVPRWFPTSWRA